jgi:hypothetical protein
MRSRTAILVALAIAACGRAPAPAPPAPIAGAPAPVVSEHETPPLAPDPCVLLTPGEVAAALGRSDLGRPQLDSAPNGGRTCRYQAGVGGTVNISVIAQMPDEYDVVRGHLANEQPPPERVAALGDDAYVWNNRLYVRQGSMRVTVWFEGRASSDRAAAARLAAAAIAKLR